MKWPFVEINWLKHILIEWYCVWKLTLALDRVAADSWKLGAHCSGCGGSKWKPLISLFSSKNAVLNTKTFLVRGTSSPCCENVFDWVNLLFAPSKSCEYKLKCLCAQDSGSTVNILPSGLSRPARALENVEELRQYF